jgi:hypothetical protein
MRLLVLSLINSLIVHDSGLGVLIIKFFTRELCRAQLKELIRMAFVAFWASLIVTTTMNEIAIFLERFLPSVTTSTHLSHTFSYNFIVSVL